MTYSGVLLGLLKERSEVFISFLLLVASLAPFGNSLSVEDENVEESVEEQDVRRLDGGRIEEDRLAAILVECV